MANNKAKPGLLGGKTEGGSGGKRGHSNMTHWSYTEEIKMAAKRARRIQSKEMVRHALSELE